MNHGKGEGQPARGDPIPIRPGGGKLEDSPAASWCGARPLPVLAGLLAAATFVGLALGRSPQAVPGFRLLATALPPGLARALVFALVSIALGTAGFLAARRMGRSVPTWLVLFLALALARAARLEPEGAAPRVPGEATAKVRDRPVLGRFRSAGGNRGRIEGAHGEPAPLAGVLLQLATPPPPNGAWCALLPGEEPVPWPRGPVPGPSARGTDPLGSVKVHPDAFVAESDPSRRGRFAGLRESLGERIDGLESRRTPGLLRALLLGDKSRVEPKVLDLFTRTGTRHLLALSGLHVGLLAAALLVPLTALLGRVLSRLARALGIRGRDGNSAASVRWIVAVLRIALLAAYVALVGARDPVTRAAAALGLAWAAPLLPRRRSAAAGLPTGRRVDPLSIWGAALLAELLVAPRGLNDPSLRLSYMATLGILLGTAPIRAGIRNGVWILLGRERGEQELRGMLPRPLPLRFAGVLFARLARSFALALAVSIAAVLATFPETQSRFGEFSPFGILLTPLAMPFLLLLLPLGVLATAMPAAPLGSLLAGLADRLVELLHLGDKLPWTPLPLPPRPTPLVFLLVAACFLLMRMRSRSARLPRGLRIVCALTLLPWCPAPAGLELHALDVGNGNALCLRAPGIEALVFDAGSRNRRRVYREALAPLLAKWEVNHPIVVLSHNHGDHRSALPRMLERYPPRLWAGALPAEIAAHLAPSTARFDLRVGRASLPLGGPLDFALVRGSEDPGNEGSRSLEIRIQGETILLSGDAEGSGLACALDEHWMRGPLRLLLFPHHGSDTSELPALFESLDPEEIWISSSRPPAVAAELDRRGATWSFTGRDGPLQLSLPNVPGRASTGLGPGASTPKPPSGYPGGPLWVPETVGRGTTGRSPM